MCADCFHLVVVENPKHITWGDDNALTEICPEGPTVCVFFGFSGVIKGTSPLVFVCLCAKKHVSGVFCLEFGNL